MLVHLTRISIICVILVFFIFYPFIPGSYDAHATTISFITQIAVFVGLLFVPLGFLWLLFIWQNRKRKNDPTINYNYRFLCAAIVIAGLLAVIISFSAFAMQHIVFALALSALNAYVLFKLMVRIKRSKNHPSKKINLLPFYLIFIPLIVCLIRMLWIVPATEFSRNRAIKNSEPLIADIENYYQRNGQYPPSLHSLHEDYDPLVKGIYRFYYEPHGHAYNLFFEQFSYSIGVKEIVMYNKLGEQQISSHNYDLLHLSRSDINRQRGYHFSKEMEQENWKYFWFD